MKDKDLMQQSFAFGDDDTETEDTDIDKIPSDTISEEISATDETIESEGEVSVGEADEISEVEIIDKAADASANDAPVIIEDIDVSDTTHDVPLAEEASDADERGEENVDAPLVLYPSELAPLETPSEDTDSNEVENEPKEENSSADANAESEETGEAKAEEVSLPSPTIDEVTPEKKEPEKEEKTSFVRAAFDFLEMFVFTLVAVLVITSFIIRPSVVNGDSMQDTLENEQVLLISSLFYTPKKGDIVVVEDYATVLKKPIVKRIIATEGDVVRVTKTEIIVNGEALYEPYVRIDDPSYEYATWYVDCFGDKHDLRIGRDFYEITVPKGELFILGDHRNASKDSREIGTVDKDTVIGKVLLRVMPFDYFGKV